MCCRVRGWLLAASQGITGLVPANYIQILGRSQGSQGTNTRQPDIVQATVAPRAAGGNNSLDDQWAKQLS